MNRLPRAVAVLSTLLLTVLGVGAAYAASDDDPATSPVVRACTTPATGVVSPQARQAFGSATVCRITADLRSFAVQDVWNPALATSTNNAGTVNRLPLAFTPGPQQEEATLGSWLAHEMVAATGQPFDADDIAPIVSVSAPTVTKVTIGNPQQQTEVTNRLFVSIDATATVTNAAGKTRTVTLMIQGTVAPATNAAGYQYVALQGGYLA